jgi:hypothetical protein
MTPKGYAVLVLAAVSVTAFGMWALTKAAESMEEDQDYKAGSSVGLR